MQKLLFIIAVAIGTVSSVLGIGLFLVYSLSSAGRAYVNLEDVLAASHYGQFVGGFFGTILSMVAAFLLFATLINQSMTNARVAFESNFYRMMDYHFHHIASLNVRHVRAVTDASSWEMVSGNRAFIVFRLHLERLLNSVLEINGDLELGLDDDQVIDIACVAFYYGLEEDTSAFLMDRLAEYPCHKDVVQRLLDRKNQRLQHNREHVGRANQTNLGSYFRNMYHMIKYVDTRRFLSTREKQRYVNVLRAQLSNTELWLLYFNVVSRFGRKWLDRRYVERYQLIRNLPRGFCKPFDHTGTFPMQYEEY